MDRWHLAMDTESAAGEAHWYACAPTRAHAVSTSPTQPTTHDCSGVDNHAGVCGWFPLWSQGRALRCVCVFLKKRGEGGRGREVYFSVLRREGGTSLGQGRELTGKVGKRTPERTAQVPRLGHKNMTARKVAHLQSAGIHCST